MAAQYASMVINMDVHMTAEMMGTSQYCRPNML